MKDVIEKRYIRAEVPTELTWDPLIYTNLIKSGKLHYVY